MSARQKLNVSYFGGSLLLAAIIGGLTQSWLVFVLTLVVLVAINLYLNEIRPKRPRG